MKRDIPIAVRKEIKIKSPTTSTMLYGPDQMEFLRAMNEFKVRYRKPFPTWREVLAVLLSLGYEKTGEPRSIDEVISEFEES